MHKFLKVGAAVCVLCMVALLARGDGATQSFNATNRVDDGVVVRTYPTNANSGVLTGSGISVANHAWLGFYVTGQSGAAGNLTVTLVKSPYTSPTTYSNYESTATLTMTVPLAGTGAFMWNTNIPEWWVRSANYIGINNITNNGGSSSNLEFGVVKKLIPPGSR